MHIALLLCGTHPTSISNKFYSQLTTKRNNIITTSDLSPTAWIGLIYHGSYAWNDISVTRPNTPSQLISSMLLYSQRQRKERMITRYSH